eukprot:CAMPEP_0182505710 /NCGR_PEP_ID=MMETSP1321-20130603/19766_1 /TAXON_ID=91990 /ORGANISM="Bolidomonas sp., Strain RCC1657" /LENGTH=40 /DNA_ID= /DNA_START= /DNA_END= /DNA_ORIENTATION=
MSTSPAPSVDFLLTALSLTLSSREKPPLAALSGWVRPFGS